MVHKQMLSGTEKTKPMRGQSALGTDAISPIRAIAIILAYGVLRLQQRQKALDNLTEPSVHHRVLPAKKETL
jgi:hypothetical protein